MEKNNTKLESYEIDIKSFENSLKVIEEHLEKITDIVTQKCATDNNHPLHFFGGGVLGCTTKCQTEIYSMNILKDVALPEIFRQIHTNSWLNMSYEEKLNWICNKSFRLREEKRF